MLRVIIFSLAALVLVFLWARSSGLTPQQVEDRILLAELNADAGEAYRRAQLLEPGVVSLPNGLLVQLLREGDGDVPAADDWVRVHYSGWRIDGRQFDSSRRRDEPATLPLERAIPGWRQALQVMPVGSRLRLVLPPELAYGRAGAGVIGPEETLVFELELLEIVVPDTPVEPDPSQLPVPNLR